MSEQLRVLVELRDNNNAASTVEYDQAKAKVLA